MGPVAMTAVLVAAVVAAVALLVVVVVLLRAARTQRERLDRELHTSRDEVAQLSSRVAALSEEVSAARRGAEEEREHVITTLAGGGDAAAPVPYAEERERPAVGRVVEDQLVGALARRQDGSRLGARAVDLVVRTVALGHGVRRALSPDVLDRAAAEAHVARRRSRRDRRRELREARRIVRGARLAEDPDRDPGPGRHRSEDAA